jgi:hypothetical protein
MQPLSFYVVSTREHHSFSQKQMIQDEFRSREEAEPILIGTKNFTKRYYRDKAGWLKISASGRTLRMTAEQVLTHVLPAVA